MCKYPAGFLPRLLTEVPARRPGPISESMLTGSERRKVHAAEGRAVWNVGPSRRRR
jgi:hypothetical protein